MTSLESPKSFSAAMQLVEIKNEEQATKIAELYIEAKRKSKQLEEERTKLTRPLLAAKRNIDEKVKAASEPLTKVIEHLTSLLETWEQHSRGEKQKRIEALAVQEKDKERAKDMVTFAAVGTGYKYSGLRWVKDVEYKVIEPEQIPKEFWQLDSKKVKAALKAGTEIPGLEEKIVYRLGVTGK